MTDDQTTKDLIERVTSTPPSERLWGLLTGADGLCQLCRGSGSLICFQAGRREFWDCPACAGVGARKVFSLPKYKTNAR